MGMRDSCRRCFEVKSIHTCLTKWGLTPLKQRCNKMGVLICIVYYFRSKHMAIDMFKQHKKLQLFYAVLKNQTMVLVLDWWKKFNLYLWLGLFSDNFKICLPTITILRRPIKCKLYHFYEIAQWNKKCKTKKSWEWSESTTGVQPSFHAMGN